MKYLSVCVFAIALPCWTLCQQIQDSFYRFDETPWLTAALFVFEKEGCSIVSTGDDHTHVSGGFRINLPADSYIVLFNHSTRFDTITQKGNTIYIRPKVMHIRMTEKPADPFPVNPDWLRILEALRGRQYRLITN